MMLRIKQLKIGTYGIFAFLIIALATLLRIFLIAWGWPHSNADVDTMGIMAMHIAYKGEHPIFYYGQNYQGALQAYLGVVFFRLFGISVFSLRLGSVLFFALFLVIMYCLASLLYTKKLALITLALLSLGSSIMLDAEIAGLAGYPELLFFGSLSMLLASWLALSYDQYSSPNRRLWRSIAYGCWGLVAGLGFWSDFLMLVFILLSGLLLVLFCWRELLQFAVLPLVSGLIIGAFPLIVYNLNAAPGQNTLTVLRYLHNNGSLQLAQLSAHNPIPFGPQLRGTLLTGLPAAIGGSPFCYDAYTHFRLAGYLGAENVTCSIAHSNWSLVGVALAWSTGFILLWSIATFLTIRHLWELRKRTPGQLWTTREKQAVIRDFARLMLLCSAALTLYLFVSSPISAAFPSTSRYLIGLLISTPALIAPLWSLSRDYSTTSQRVHSENNDLSRNVRFPFALNFATLKIALRRGVLLLIGMALLVGSIHTLFEIPAVQVYNHQQDALILDLSRLKITHFYSDYWTCDSIVFLSKEHLICGSVDNGLHPQYNRYLPYLAIVKADPNSAYVFPLGASQIASIAKKATHSSGKYQRFDFDGFVIYLPLQTSIAIPAGHN
jgi:hypothetical protein